MHIVIGGTGRVGSATARALLKRGEPVTVVTRDAAKGADLSAAGARIAVADIRDAGGLREVFRTGTRAFLLNPPADPSADTDAEERANVAAILEALDGSGLRKVVAASTYGARPGERCGDLTVLHGFEERLFSQAAARSYACMTRTIVDDEDETPDDPDRGTTTLRAYIRGIVDAGG